MLIDATVVDATVARSFAVIGWTRHLLTLGGGAILVANGVHGQNEDDPSELRGIREALRLRAGQEPQGSGIASRALAAVAGLDQLLGLGPAKLRVLTLTGDELELAVRLQSRQPYDRAWRHSLGAKGRRLHPGESASIAIAFHRRLAFASDDEDALTLWHALAGTQGSRTGDLLWRLVTSGIVAADDARAEYERLQTDELHTLGGPEWAAIAHQPPSITSNIADGPLLDVRELSIDDIRLEDQESALYRALVQILERPSTGCNFNSFNSSI